MSARQKPPLRAYVPPQLCKVSVRMNPAPVRIAACRCGNPHDKLCDGKGKRGRHCNAPLCGVCAIPRGTDAQGKEQHRCPECSAKESA